jgi:hypothetical protein
MWVLYRTAYPPVEYKASSLSCAFLFRVVCLLIAYVAPIVIGVIIGVGNASTQQDAETPSVVPNKILHFFAIDTGGQSHYYPPISGSGRPLGSDALVLETNKTIVDDKLTEWSLLINVTSPIVARSVAVVFSFNVRLERWATNQIQAVGSFSQTFPIGVSHVSCVGDLVLEQNEVVPFHGSFQNASLDIPQPFSVVDLLKKQDELSTLFYVDWEQPNMEFGLWTCLTVRLTIRVSNVVILHSIPLVASLESTLLLILSLMFFTASVMNALQGFVFRKGIIRTWAVPHYVPSAYAKTQ